MLKSKPIKKQRELSLIEFSKRFSNIHECQLYYKNIRWPDGNITCPHCGFEKIYVTDRGYKCANTVCLKKFSLVSDTLFACKKIPLTTWFYLIYTSAINRKSTSSVQLAKNLGITQKTAWHSMHDMRVIFHEDRLVRLEGVVEIDECFLGGGGKWTRWGKISTRKQPVIGMVQRDGLAIIKIIEDRSEVSIEKIVLNHVSQESTIYTDGWLGYNGLQKYYMHDFVNHSSHEYVRGDVHTNNAENLWGILKRSIRNGHQQIGAYHVQRYCDEVAYKYNTRKLGTWDRFNDMLLRTDFTKEKSIYNLSGLVVMKDVIPMYQTG